MGQGLTSLNMESARRMLEMQILKLSEDMTLNDVLLFVLNEERIKFSLKKELLDSFDNINLDEEKDREDFFSKVCSLIKEEFNKVKEADYVIKDDMIRILLIKLLVIIKSCYINFNNSDNLNFIKDVINSKLGYNKYELLFKILCNNKLVDDVNKRDILIKYIFDRDIRTITSVDEEYTGFFNFLTRNDILEKDDETFEKIAKLAITNVLNNVLNKVFNNENISNNKREILLDYYCNLLDDLIKRQVFAIEKNVQNIGNESIFMVGLSDILLDMDDKEYENSLNTILEKKNPNAYSLLLSSDIDNKKREVVLSYVSDVKKRDNYYYIDTDKNKLDLVKASISLGNIEIDDDIFNKLLALINNNSRDFENARKIIIKLINNCNMFLEKQKRLLYIVTIISENSDSDKINDIYNFSSNINSLIYSDSEYMMIINIIINSTSKSERDMIVKRFTSDKVLSMVDKSILFDSYLSNMKLDALKKKELTRINLIK